MAEGQEEQPPADPSAPSQPAGDPDVVRLGPPSRPTNQAGPPSSAASAPDNQGAADEFDEAGRYRSRVTPFGRVRRSSTRERTQSGIAYVIVAAVFVLYAASLWGLLDKRIDTDTFKEVALALAGPLGLATAVAGFYYGSEKER